MLKIKELLKSLVETQKQINESLKDLKSQTTTWTKTGITVDRMEARIGAFETNVYSKEQTVEAINKECDYRDSFKECDEKNPALLQLIEEYFRYDDKYEIIDLFRYVDSLYEVKKRK